MSSNVIGFVPGRLSGVMLPTEVSGTRAATEAVRTEGATLQEVGQCG